MIYEWDETRRLRTIAERKLDFLDVDLIFSGPHLVGPARTVGGEARSIAVGIIDGVHATVIFTVRGEATRIISRRRARNDERRRHQAVFGG